MSGNPPNPTDPPADPPADPPVDPPADPPADPPHDSNDELRTLIGSLAEKVDTLTARVESLATPDGERDATPVSRPWIYRGRR